MNEVVKRIDELRKIKGLTKKELMKKMGVPASTCNSWYYADSMPSLSNIDNVCKALGITCEQFFSGLNGVNTTKSEEKFLDEWRILNDAEKLAVKNCMEAFKFDKAVQND